MRTRKLLYPAEKVWVDKHKYDEAERLYYEREATRAAGATGTCREVVAAAVAVNGFCDDVPVNEEPKDHLQRARNAKKQKRRKFSPQAKPLYPQVDLVLAGLLVDSVWLDKPLFDQAETTYQRKLANLMSRVASKSALGPGSEAGLPPGVAKPKGNLAPLHCGHGILIACHHVVQDVWVNKPDFDDAEKRFVERSQLAALPSSLNLPPVTWRSNKDSLGSTTPADEGYVTALPTPSTPAQSVSVAVHVRSSFVSPGLPGASDQTVNGKPQNSDVRALISEVWLEKPLYDNAERCFYASMFDGHPPGKVRLQERGRPESSKRSRKDKKNRGAGKQVTGKKGSCAAPAAVPWGAAHSPPAWCFAHKDSESSWLSKPLYDSAEAQFYASKASKVVHDQESPRASEVALAKPPQPAARASSAPESKTKKMAADFLVHEKIWFEKYKYDDAERKYYEQMNGPLPSPCGPQENGASMILRDIARARENIQKSLAGLKTVLKTPHEASPTRRQKQSGQAAASRSSLSSTSAAGPAGDQSELITRIVHLEVENQSLRSVVTDLQQAISRLETRLSVLEKTSTSHHPSPTLPTQHVPPMKKVEPLAISSRKIDLPVASPAKKVESPVAVEEEEEEDDDDIDLFGSDDEEEDQEAARLREERLQQYAAKKSKKPGLIAKSSILLDVKPWDDETDMAKMEENVRSVQMDGLVWGASKLVPVGYGIKKLQIQCVVEDDKVGTDILEEEITKFEDYVQSVDIAAFNKI